MLYWSWFHSNMVGMPGDPTAMPAVSMVTGFMAWPMNRPGGVLGVSVMGLQNQSCLGMVCLQVRPRAPRMAHIWRRWVMVWNIPRM